MMKNWKFGRIDALLASVALMVGQAHAALPAGVTTALDEAKTDGVEAAGLVLVAIIGIYAIKLIRRAL